MYKVQGNQRMNNGLRRRRRPYQAFFPHFFFVGVVQNSHFNSEQVEICYFGSFMGVIFPWEDTANIFIVRVAYAIENSDMINLKIAKKSILQGHSAVDVHRVVMEFVFLS